MKNKYLSYDTYNFFLTVFERERKELYQSYTDSMLFIPPQEMTKNKETNRGIAHDIYIKRLNCINEREEELKSAMKQIYKNHPDKQMREFWGYKK